MSELEQYEIWKSYGIHATIVMCLCGHYVLFCF